MLWFIIDDEKEMNVFVDGNRVYSVADVIRIRDSGLNSDCDLEEEADSLDSHVSNRSSGVSKRMIELFFDAKEGGPDRDWSQFD